MEPEQQLQPAISPLRADDLERGLEVWEASVRATHHFLQPGDVELFRPYVRKALLEGPENGLELACLRDREGSMVGFLGVAEGKVEMLFIDPAWRGRGLGRRLLEHALDELGATTVDVNEQNEQAVGFYRRMGFRVVGRSERDGLGKPYPLLHMALEGPRNHGTGVQLGPRHPRK